MKCGKAEGLWETAERHPKGLGVARTWLRIHHPSLSLSLSLSRPFCPSRSRPLSLCLSSCRGAFLSCNPSSSHPPAAVVLPSPLTPSPSSACRRHPSFSLVVPLIRIPLPSLLQASLLPLSLPPRQLLRSFPSPSPFLNPPPPPPPAPSRSLCPLLILGIPFSLSLSFLVPTLPSPRLWCHPGSVAR